MARKIYTLTDLGPGDGGKGGVVHKLCTTVKPHTILKVGGCQGSHGVTTQHQGSFNFSHFGCGTLEGIKTHITEQMIIEPYRLQVEANQLKYEKGIRNIYDYLTIDRYALCVTPYHTFSSQLRELLRKDKPKGTVGIGVGEALRDSEQFSEDAIFAKDLLDTNYVRSVLQRVRDKKIEEFRDVLHSKNLIDFFNLNDVSDAKKLINFFLDNDLIGNIVNIFHELSKKVSITDESYFNKLLNKEGNMVVESSHGVLNDRMYGFYPHVTHLHILPQFTIDMLQKYAYSGEIKKLAVTRAYQIRHGAGPMPTYNPTMSEKLLPGSSKLDNRWQGRAMVGALDFNLLRYAVEISGGVNFFDGLAVTWFDQILHNQQWDICKNYTESISPFMSDTQHIVPFTGNSDEQINYQLGLTQSLYQIQPVISSIDLSGKTTDESINLCIEQFQTEIKIPVKMLSTGPIDSDKILL